MRKNKSGFTLIELLIVIVILGALSSLIAGNFITSLTKGRDAKRKSDLSEIHKAIELYYEDNRAYPLLGSTIPKDTQFCLGYLAGVPSSSKCDEKVYMSILPTDPIEDFNYQYITDANGTYFKIYSCIENTNDEGSNVKQVGYDGTNCSCSGTTTKCKYGISSPNVSP